MINGFKEKMKDVLKRPSAAIMGGFALFGNGFGLLDPMFSTFAMIVELVGVTSGLWFPLISLTNSFASMLSWIPVSLAQNAFLVAGAIYAAYIVDGLIDKVKKKISER
ncbi:hypothetical protein [Halolamina salifodinae]|uniref:Uncharacterized protein n=1 Tax=Halolamina salifodinae TaxID=1202767 RepID=A0A8T4GV42_9EURY|nr:hypothetical protein [Halolamina salifodinae]MBP1985943.1 hypothetical protein [Halolamina salifodinae]